MARLRFEVSKNGVSIAAEDGKIVRDA